MNVLYLMLRQNMDETWKLQSDSELSSVCYFWDLRECFFFIGKDNDTALAAVLKGSCCGLRLSTKLPTHFDVPHGRGACSWVMLITNWWIYRAALRGVKKFVFVNNEYRSRSADEHWMLLLWINCSCYRSTNWSTWLTTLTWIMKSRAWSRLFWKCYSSICPWSRLWHSLAGTWN